MYKIWDNVSWIWLEHFFKSAIEIGTKEEKHLQTALSVLHFLQLWNNVAYKYLVSLGIVVASWMNIVQKAVCMSSVWGYDVFIEHWVSIMPPYTPPHTQYTSQPLFAKSTSFCFGKTNDPFTGSYARCLKINLQSFIVGRCSSWVNFWAN